MRYNSKWLTAYKHLKNLDDWPLSHNIFGYVSGIYYICLCVCVCFVGRTVTQCDTTDRKTLKCSFPENINSTRKNFEVYFYPRKGDEGKLPSKLNKNNLVGLFNYYFHHQTDSRFVIAVIWNCIDCDMLCLLQCDI